jgi:DNA-binding transcriptional regulator YhcF (GntR family)
MIVDVDLSSPVPPFEQVRNQISAMAAAGVLPVGTRLPSIRQLAADLGLAPGTVARAYRELEAEGVVVSRVRHGTTVLARPEPSEGEKRARLDDAARVFALTARAVGADPGHALQVVRAALALDHDGGETRSAGGS